MTDRTIGTGTVPTRKRRPKRAPQYVYEMTMEQKADYIPTALLLAEKRAALTSGMRE